MSLLVKLCKDLKSYHTPGPWFMQFSLVRFPFYPFMTVEVFHLCARRYTLVPLYTLDFISKEIELVNSILFEFPVHFPPARK